jgi:hypothetical protein
MNLSGEPVATLLRYYKLDADSLIVIHDDLALPQGVEFPHTANYSVVAVVPPTKEEEVAPVPVEGEEGVEGEAAEGEAAEGEAAEGAPAAEGKKEGGEGKEAKKE